MIVMGKEQIKQPQKPDKNMVEALIKAKQKALVNNSIIKK